MIAAALVLGGGIQAPRDPLDSVLRALGRAVGLPPVTTLVSGNALLAAWPGPPRAALDPAVRYVVEGEVRGLASLRTLEDADALRGAFALAGATPDGLLLARGRFGGRPLYLAFVRGVAVACSRIGPLRALIGAAPSPDVATLAAAVGVTPPLDATRTVFDAIARVPSGSALLVGPDGIRARRLLRFEPPPVRDAAPEALAAELRARLAASVRRAVGDRRRVAVLTSGGVDSSGLLALTLAEARGASRAEVDAITLDFAGGWGDDRPYLRALSDALGIVPIRVPAAGAGALARSTLVLDGAPTAFPTAATNVLLHRAARARGADVILCGHGGDDLFTGNVDVFAARARAGHLVEAARGALALELTVPFGPMKRIAELLAKPLLREHVPAAWLRRRHRRQTLAYRAWAGPRMRAHLAALADSQPSAPLASALDERRAMRDLATSAVLTNGVDGRGLIEASVGTEQCDPFLDDDVAELVATIPSHVMHHGGRLRGLFRLALPASVPDVVRHRWSKASFQVSLREMLDAAGGKDAFRDLVDVRCLADLGLVEPAAFAREFERLGQGRGPEWRSVWPALSVEAFLRGEGWARASSAPEVVADA